MTLAAQAFGALDCGREDAESRLSDFTKLARAILPVSPKEAAAFFTRAVEVASHIGEENLDRWDALLNLGRAAADPAVPRPRTAHRLSRAAELTYEYVARDKHFDWNQTVYDLADLCPSSAFTILSRWRDRRFGDAGRLLPLALGRLVRQGHLPPTAPIAFAACDARWDRLATLGAAEKGLTDPAARETALQVAYRYIRVESHSHETWLGIHDLGERLGVAFLDIDRLLAATKPRLAPTARPLAAPLMAPTKEHRNPDWDELFAGVNFTDPGALRVAFNAVRTYDPPYRFEEFFHEVMARAGAGREPEVIEAVASWPDFGQFELRHLLNALPKPLPALPALRASVKRAVLEACRRQPEHVWRHDWSGISFEELETKGIVTDAAVLAAIVEGFAAKVDHLGARALFRAVDSLASQLTPGEADEALNYGLDLLEGLLGPSDADGPWRPALEPPADLLSALAGYIWAGLGSPVAAVRWQFAHVVRCVGELGWSDLLEAILAWAQCDGAGAFVDQGLQFYVWHARQWLAIGLARAALSAPTAMAASAPLLRSLTDLSHVLIRELAAQALQRLAAAGVIDQSDAADPIVVNRPALPVKRFRGWVDIDGEDAEQVAEPPPPDEEKYYFGIDIGPYWFQRLGRVFGLAQSAIERRALAVVRDRLGWKLGTWRDDARRGRKIFRDGEASHLHGSLPRTDDLTAYHGYHAMMMVAADLLRTHRIRWPADEDSSSFEAWLSKYRLTRSDGMWLADRRDPCLAPDLPALDQGEADAARRAFSSASLGAQLVSDRGDPVVWGCWSSRQGEQTQTVSVSSALVTRATAESLVVALQSAAPPPRFVLPDANHGDTLEAEGFRCVPWIHGGGGDLKIDEHDPWAARLHYPGPSPTEAVMAALSLTADADLRAWRNEAGGLLWAETWAQEAGHQSEPEILRGWRLAANRRLLEHLFRARPDDCLILCVSIQRYGSRYSPDRSDSEDPAWPYEVYYLMGSDGVAHSF